VRKVFQDDEGRLRSGWAMGFYLVAIVLLQTGSGALLYLLRLPMAPTDHIDDLALIPMALGRLTTVVVATWAGCRLVRQGLGDAWLRDGQALRRLFRGMVLGGLAVSAVVLFTWALGYQSLHLSSAPAGQLVLMALVNLAVLIPASASEEFLLRGFLLQQFGRGVSGLGRLLVTHGNPAHPDAAGAGLRLGNGLAVLLTGVLFGLMHGSNPNVTVVAVLNIILVGLWFGAVVLRTGSLWVPVGLHTGWNWFQGFFWGEPISGLKARISLMSNVDTGREAWTGGAFGPEASVSASLVLAVLVMATVLWKPKGRPPSMQADA